MNILIQKNYSLRVNGARFKPQKRILRLEGITREEEPLQEMGLDKRSEKKQGECNETKSKGNKTFKKEGVDNNV